MAVAATQSCTTQRAPSVGNLAPPVGCLAHWSSAEHPSLCVGVVLVRPRLRGWTSPGRRRSEQRALIRVVSQRLIVILG